MKALEQLKQLPYAFGRYVLARLHLFCHVGGNVDAAGYLAGFDE
ncbi:hypothetical protein [Hymenobacter sp. GOD-10R]|nr:hypothetical protein [Hymenobacter sp. GOD-10R]WRQ26959.1 hypothetical protein SD425_17955 [Hymenobacter sp. GOD-10R]